MDEKSVSGTTSDNNLSQTGCPRSESLIKAALVAAVVVSALAVFAIFGFLLYFSLPLFFQGNFADILLGPWRPFYNSFGILPMIIGSVSLALLALVLAYPVGLGICLFAHGLGPPKLARPVLAMIHFMTGIPTVVYGFVSAVLLVPFLRSGFTFSSGFSLLAAALTLSLLILPTIVLLMNSQLQQVTSATRLTAAALGIHPAQELIWITLPAASRGLTTAAILGFGRAIGDTLIALMVAGNAAQIPHSVFDSIRTLTAHIALVVATDSQSAAFHSLFACGLILFAITTSINLALHWISPASQPGGKNAHV
jgi:phosphate transport system permease protein